MGARWSEYNRMLDLTNPAPDPPPSHLPDIFSFGVIGEGERSGEYIAIDFSSQYIAK